MGGVPVVATPDRQMQVVRVETPSPGAMDRQAPRSVPPFGTNGSYADAGSNSGSPP